MSRLSFLSFWGHLWIRYPKKTPHFFLISKLWLSNSPRTPCRSVTNSSNTWDNCIHLQLKFQTFKPQNLSNSNPNVLPVISDSDYWVKTLCIFHNLLLEIGFQLTLKTSIVVYLKSFRYQSKHDFNPDKYSGQLN